MKEKINVWDYAGHILEHLGKGVLLTTQAEGKANTMTIGWGHLGIEWGKPICIVYVRQSRHTKALLDKTGEFTVNIPYGEFDKNILGVCGTKSGRDMDKFAALGLEAVPGETVNAPAIRQLPLTLECKVIYKQDQELSAIDPESLSRYYGQGTSNEGDFHTAYYGLITDAYILK